MHDTTKRLYEAVKFVKPDMLLTKANVSRFLDISQQVLKNWEDRPTGISKQGMFDIEKQTGISAVWLESGNGEMLVKKQEETKFVGVPPQSHIMSDDNFDHSHTHLSIPRYEVKLSAGNGTAQWVELTDKEPLIFRASWFFERHLSPEHLRAMTVKGDSMTPVLENGDTVIIDIEDTEIIDGEIYAILYKEKLYIKELRHTENGVLMISKNTDYNAIAVTQHDENRFFVLGRKVWRGG